MATVQSENSPKCFSLFIGSSNKPSTHLLVNTTGLIAPKAVGGGMDICSFYSGPTDAAIMAFGESYESAGAIAFSDESCGAIACSEGYGESCGAIASSSSGSSDCGGCNYTV